MTDLIDRAALEIDAWERLSDAVCALEKAPSVHAKPVVHGEWNIIEDDYVGTSILECSLCHEEWIFEDVFSDELHLVNYNFCPNCGADMREREENG